MRNPNQFTSLSQVKVLECPVCLGHEFEPIEQYNFDGIKTAYSACSDCGLVLMNPRPTEQSLKEYYSSKYWEERDYAQALKKQDLFAKHIISFINNYQSGFLKDVSSILEIGSSFGVTLSNFKRYTEELGSQVSLFAIEPSSRAVEIGKDSYIDISFLGQSFESIDNHSGNFDLVILSHVLEHLPNPVEALKKVRLKMSNTSLLYLEVPNYYCHVSVDYSHLYCFTHNSLKNCLSAAGLNLIYVSLNNHYTEELPDYLTCLVMREDTEVLTQGSVQNNCSREKLVDIRRQRQPVLISMNIADLFHKECEASNPLHKFLLKIKRKAVLEPWKKISVISSKSTRSR